MNSIKYIAFILLIEIIFTADDPFIYDTCENEVFTYKIENQEYKSVRLFEAKSASDCKDRPIREYTRDSYEDGKLKSKDTTKTFFSHCCYITYDRIKEIETTYDSKYEEVGIEGYCIKLSDSQYKNIKDFVKYYSLIAGEDIAYNNVKIDCNSNYAQLGLLSLLLLILF